MSRVDTNEAGAASPNPAPPPAPAKRRKAKRRSAKREVHSTDTAIDQLPPIRGDRLEDRDSAIVSGERVDPKDTEYLAALAFNEEPVLIIINPSTDKNAATVFEAWNQGLGAEIQLDDGRWVSITYLPVNEPITVKRKILEQIARSKITNVKTVHEDATVANPRNDISRVTTAVHSFSVLNDPNPRGAAWLTAVMRRNF